MSTSMGSTGVTFPDSTTQTTAFTGGVTSAIAGNGVAVSGATGAVTFSASCPSAVSVGSYTALVTVADNAHTYSTGSNYSGLPYYSSINIYNQAITSTSPGTWKMMGVTANNTGGCGFPVLMLACRVS